MYKRLLLLPVLVSLCLALSAGTAFAESTSSPEPSVASDEPVGELMADQGPDEGSGIDVLEGEGEGEDPAVTDPATYRDADDPNLYHVNNVKGIQACLNTARESDEIITVRLEAGLYETKDLPSSCKGKLIVYSNTHLILEDGATLYRSNVKQNGLIYNFYWDSELQRSYRGGSGGYTMSHDITIEGEGAAFVDGGDIFGQQLGEDDGHDLIRIDHAENITVKNLTIKNVYKNHHLEFVAVKNGLISNCTFSGFRCVIGKEGNWSYGREAVELDAAWTDDPGNTANTSAWWAGYGSNDYRDISKCLDGTACVNCTVESCKFVDLPSCVGEHHWSSSAKYKNLSNITIKNNTFTYKSTGKNLKYAINTGGIDSATITGNTITGPYRYAIYVQHGKNATVSNNTIKGMDRIGIMVGDDVQGLTIASNKISSTKRHAISVLGDDKATAVKAIASNTIATTGSSYSAIQIGKGSTVSSIAKNKITGAGRYGVTVSKGKVSSIASNVISNAKNGGVEVTSGGYVDSAKANTVSNSKKNGFYVASGSTLKTIASNTVTASCQTGIYVSSKAKVWTISGNKLTKMSKYGIYCGSKSVKTSITKNVITVKKKSKGIKKASKVKVKASGNTIKRYK